MDWPQLIGVCSTAFVGVQAVLKVYQRLRLMMRPAAGPRNIIITNGEGKMLLNSVTEIYRTIGEMQKQQDSHAREFRGELQIVRQLIANVESRLPTL